MERSTLAIRLQSELVQVLDEQARTAGLTRSAHLAAIIGSHLRASGGDGGTPSSDELLRRHQETLHALRVLSADTNTLTHVVAQKEREAIATFAELSNQIDQLRADIATRFAAGGFTSSITRPVVRLTAMLRNRIFGRTRSRCAGH